jgi:hypothetical protein
LEIFFLILKPQKVTSQPESIRIISQSVSEPLPKTPMEKELLIFSDALAQGSSEIVETSIIVENMDSQDLIISKLSDESFSVSASIVDQVERESSRENSDLTETSGI